MTAIAPPLSRRPAALLPLLGFATALSACSGGDTTSSSSGSSTESDAGAAADSSAQRPDATSATGAKELCASYIKCISDANPGAAGPLVSLYGDASNCWKDTDADAVACGKACEKGLSDEPKCNAFKMSGSYGVLCALGSAFANFDATVTYDAVNGGQITLRPLPTQSTYEPSHALVTQPTITLTPGRDGGEGRSVESFQAPKGSYGLSTDLSMTAYEVKRLRTVSSHICSDNRGTVSGGAQPGGGCVYLKLQAGAPWPAVTPAQVTNCDIPSNVPSGG